MNDTTTRSRRRGTVALAGIAAVAAAAIVVVGLRQRSPTAFAAGNAVSGPAQVGTAHSFGIGAASRDVDIESTTVQFDDGSARAATAVWICRQARASQIGAATWTDLVASCDPLTRADGSRLHHGEFGIGAEYLAVTIVPLETGTVVIERVDVRYRSDGHERTDPTGPRIELTVTSR